MAKRHSLSFPAWLWPGCLAAGGILLLAFSALTTLGWQAPQWQLSALLHDSYLWHIIRFTFWQALLSALFSALPAIPVAMAFYRRRFPGRALLLRLYAMTLILPVLVAIFGLLNVYGNQGWLATLFRTFGMAYPFSIYGLSGILLAHVFFNLPLAIRLLLQTLENIPTEQRQIATQLGMSPFQQFRFVEWPALRRQIFPVAALIFMLCFSSFAIVLTLGGGPGATTIELAIYQALSYDFDPGLAALLALLQLFCCLGLLFISQRATKTLPAGYTLNNRWQRQEKQRAILYCDYLLIGLTVLLLIPPLLSVMINGLTGPIAKVLHQPALWNAALTSLRICLTAGLLSVVLTLMLLWSSRELRLRQHRFSAEALEISGMAILAMPSLVLGTGFFLLLSATTGIPQSADLIVILTNALMAIPFALKVLSNPMYELAERYNPVSASLGLKGIKRVYWVEGRALKKPLAQAFAFACVLSVGDFGVVALFGNEHFLTLPLYLYKQIGAYRDNEGAVTALLLLLFCFLLFTLIERLPGRHADAK